ncbi:MAG: Fpg/Nei family DNA glycosylase [Vicinamibacterales bacterium]
MPEGDTIFRTARALHRALAGRTVVRFESVFPALTRVDHSSPLAGRTIDEVSSRGKHVLITFSGDLTLRTHMRMAGSWHLYRTGERWRAPRRDMRIALTTASMVAVGFMIPVAEFLTARELARHPVLQSLGPDLADPGFDRDEARRRILAAGSTPVEEVLLDQRVVSGVGNVLKSEILFVARVAPFLPSSTLDDAAVDRILNAAARLMHMNTTELTVARPVHGRWTTGSLDPSAALYVYGRGGKPCRRCGTAISAHKTGTDARLTYWCPRCQDSAAAPR